jgi:hypothetical protein
MASSQRCAKVRALVSDSWIRIIPTDPCFVPISDAAKRGEALLARFAPASESGEPSHEVDAGKVVFIDCGANFSSITCPWCKALMDLEWWGERMTVASASSFSDLMTRTPCCDVTTSLNDLVYHWSQGFARWWLEVMNPSVGTLSATQLAEIGAAVGHEVRAVYVHL